MKVYVWDLLPYDAHFEDFKADRYIPYPLPGRHFDPETGARSFEEHLRIWAELDRLGYDGVGLNEHHTTPHGLMTSPNMMAAVGAQRTERLKFLLLGNLLPLHNPLRIAEELATVDCLSRGRVLPGFARGIPREYRAYNVPMAESRARFEEAFEIILKAWTEEVFTHEGRFWTFKDVSIWPRPYQQPHPPLWIPFTGSRETIEFAGRHNASAVLPQMKPGLVEDIVGHFAKSLAAHGHRMTPEHLCLFTDAWVADDRAAALRDYGPYYLYFNQTLWHHGSLPPKSVLDAPPVAAAPAAAKPPSTSYDYIRPENRAAVEMDRAAIRNTTLANIEARVMRGDCAWGPAKEVTERLIGAAEHMGANALLLAFNLGAMPYEPFLDQVRRFAREVLPALQAHQVTRVPAAAVTA
jgi:alkanesulfonate monooxygenase SsuD/methylene tetrahydromethanopterin reductase-like flavin-dependent oxidoreductase (luciferase family)